MLRLKNETLSIRTTAEVKDLLRQAAARERRSVASIVEMLVVPMPSGIGCIRKHPLPKNQERSSMPVSILHHGRRSFIRATVVELASR